jgi:hypothetical protein
MLGTGLKVELSSTLTWFPNSVLGMANLGRNVIVHLCALDYIPQPEKPELCVFHGTNI